MPGLRTVAAGLCLSLLFTAAGMAEEKTTLRWRPQSKARMVSVQKKPGINRTQLLMPLEDSSLQSEDSQDAPMLDLAPGVRPVLQPDPQQDPMRRPSPFEPQQSPLAEALQPVRPRQPEPCPSPSDFKRITSVNISLDAPEGDFPQYCPLSDEPFVPRAWAPLTYTWKATALCHKPLYFEERALERYGHTVGHFQPLVSGAMFFGTLPILPYKMGMHSPWECMYTLGYYQPGSCAPWIVPPVPLNLRGALLEAGAWTGGAFAIP